MCVVEIWYSALWAVAIVESCNRGKARGRGEKVGWWRERGHGEYGMATLHT